MKRLSALVLTGILFLLGGCKEKSEDDQIRLRPTESQKVQLTTLNNNPLELSLRPKWAAIKGMEGKAVMLVFFATWCPPCKAEIPHLTALQKQFGDKLFILGVNLEEGKTRDELLTFAQEQGVGYSMSYGKANMALADALGGIRGFPTMYLFAPSGELAVYYPGAASFEMMQADIGALVGSK